MKIIVYLYFLCLAVYSIGQANLDNLCGVWNDTNQSDTARLKAIHNFTYESYLFCKPDNTYYNAGLAYDFANSTGHKSNLPVSLIIRCK